jgi:hypothetical protein
MRPVYEFRPHMRSINLEEASIFKQIPANKGRQKKAGVPIVVIHTKSGVIRKVARTAKKRAEMKQVRNVLQQLNGLKGQNGPIQITAVKVETPIKWKYTMVQRVMRTTDGNRRVKMCKLTNNKGVRKYFVTKKAAKFFVDGLK